MKSNKMIGLVTAGWLLLIGALNINDLNNVTIFGLSADLFKGILIGLSLTANTMVIIKLRMKPKQKMPMA